MSAQDKTKYPTSSPKKYIAKNLFDNDFEIKFFKLLHEGLKGLFVFPHVSMNQILDVENQKSQSDRYAFWAQIVDFVISTPDGEIIAIVEYDGKSHENPDTKAKDKIRDERLKQAEYIVLRYNWKEEINKTKLQRDFKTILTKWKIHKELKAMGIDLQKISLDDD